MALIKCDNCGKEISSNADSCIHCGTKLDNTIKTKGIITDYETENNIAILTTLSNIIKWLMLIGGVILLFIAFLIGDGIGVLFFFGGVFLIIFAFILPEFIKWKALMLKNIYELNRKN